LAAGASTWTDQAIPAILATECENPLKAIGIFIVAGSTCKNEQNDACKVAGVT